MASLDFSELGSRPAGENLEGLVRLMGERLGLTVSWSGRGADQGRDLIFVETQTGRIGAMPVRWLVNCKDNSKTKHAVTEQDVGSIVDKVQQHRCQGFLLATTTTVGTALKAKMDALASHPQTPIQTKVWDRFELTSKLLSDQFADLLRQFFPKQRAQSAAIELDAAREKIEASVPRVVVGALRTHLVPYLDRVKSLSGALVWPNDADQQKIIDQAVPKIIGRTPHIASVTNLRELHFDAFLAFIDQLIRTFPDDAYNHVLFYAQEERDSGRTFNLLQILREFDSFTDDLELAIAAHCDDETLWELYDDFVVQSLSEEIFWESQMPGQIERFHESVEINSIEVNEVLLTGGDSISFEAQVHFDVSGSTDYGDDGYSSRETFTFHVIGYLEAPLRAQLSDVKSRR